MEAAKTTKPVTYMRRRPELTPCYRILQNHLDTFISDRDRESQFILTSQASKNLEALSRMA